MLTASFINPANGIKMSAVENTLAFEGDTALRSAEQLDPRARRILDNFEQFDALIRRAEALFAAKDLRSAATYASMAAAVAVENHCGIFSSPRIERLLTSIGKATEPSKQVRPMPTSIRRVLHIATEVYPVGGHTKMMRLWVENDTGRQHSLALTQQGCDIPPDLRATFERQGGKIYRRLNRLPGGVLATANALRRIARDYDMVVLHLGNTDAAPSIAFAQSDRHPPAFFLNHADHLFWIGSAVSQVVGGMRDAAIQLAETRRGIDRARNILVPILVSPTTRVRTREEARKALGIADDEVLLISVARRAKYRALNGKPYADVHAQVLRKFPRARLMVVGAGEQPDWAPAIQSVGGRIEALTARDPKPYFEAADIYLDSYPFCSATSMMEAAGYGLPCITRFILPAGARICGMDHPGLLGPLIEVNNDADYQARLSELILDSDLRQSVGAAMSASVERSNVPPGWSQYLEAAYAQVLALPRPDGHEIFAEGPEQPCLGEPDIRIEDIYGYQRHIPHHLLMEHLSRLSLSQRLRDWAVVGKAGTFAGPKEAMRCLLSEWIVRIIKDGP